MNILRWFAVLLLLGACTPRPVLAPFPQGEPLGETAKVFTTTNRVVGQNGPEAGRSEVTSFAQLTIAIPPERRPGQIVTPRRRAADPNLDFLVAGEKSFADTRAFDAALRREIRSRPPSERDVLIYVHGFNNTFAEGVLRMAQLTHDLDLRATSVHFAWPSAANPLGYERDRGSALFSRDALEQVIDSAKSAGARRVVVIAHSMGGFLTMETLRQMDIARPGSVGRDVHGVVLISPDIDVAVFKTQARRIKKLPNVFAIFVSERDRALRLSARLTGEPNRLGTLSDPAEIADLNVTLVNVSQFDSEGGLGHFVPGTSPELIGILSRAADIEDAFSADAAGRPGLLPGSVLTIQNVTQFVLTPGGLN